MTPDEGIVYRGVYGHAARLIEIVTRKGVDPWLIELAVDDALAKRQPRW